MHLYYPGMTKENTALIVIDPVNACADEQCELPDRGITFSNIREMLPKLNAFMDEYRKSVGGLVIITKISPWTKGYLPENIQTLYTDPGALYYSDDTSEFPEQIYGIEVADTDVVVTKSSYDVFTSVEFAQTLTEKNIRYLIITGIFTDGCVLSTVINGFSRGYNFVILSDLVETTDVPVRQELQKNLIAFTFPKMYGRTVTSDDYLSSVTSQTK